MNVTEAYMSGDGHLVTRKRGSALVRMGPDILFLPSSQVQKCRLPSCVGRSTGGKKEGLSTVEIAGAFFSQDRFLSPVLFEPQNEVLTGGAEPDKSPKTLPGGHKIYVIHLSTPVCWYRPTHSVAVMCDVTKHSTCQGECEEG